MRFVRLAMTCRPPCLRLGTSSMGSLREPTVIAVRSSRYSTGLMDDDAAQAFKSAISDTNSIDDNRMAMSIPGRELEPIIELRPTGILLAMTLRSGRFSARKFWKCLWMATVAASAVNFAHASDVM